MPSLTQLLREHAPLLLLDAASLKIQVGWFPGPHLDSPRWHAAEGEAGTELFRGFEAIGAEPGAAGAFAFCEGPGSVLGIRTAAMAIRAWCALRPRPVFAYRSLALLAEATSKKGPAAAAFPATAGAELNPAAKATSKGDTAAAAFPANAGPEPDTTPDATAQHQRFSLREPPEPAQERATLGLAAGLEPTWIADARRGAWHVLTRGGPLRRVPAAELGAGPFATPRELRRWSAAPPGTREVAYNVPILLHAAADADIFSATEAPEAYLHAEPAYATWEARIHGPLPGAADAGGSVPGAANPGGRRKEAREHP